MFEDQLADEVSASPMAKMPWSARLPAVVRGLPCILVTMEAAPATDLIMRLTLKHLENIFLANSASTSRKNDIKRVFGKS